MLSHGIESAISQNEATIYLRGSMDYLTVRNSSEIILVIGLPSLRVHQNNQHNKDLNM